jgi:lipopolysaccharide transport system ATP-binding protein
MSDTVIQVENLGKKYVLSHQQEGSSRYVALRDVLSDGVRSFGHRLRHPGKPRVNPNQEEFWALKDVSFEVKRGDVVGIIGRNGAGKSTLLKILSRITEPTEGRVRLRGRVASLLEVGTGFHPELTGRENIFLNGAILGMSRAELNRKFDEIVEFAGVTRFLDTPVKRYSSGMYVRLAFSVAAHLEPEILVVDEVLAVGDVAFQKKCLGKMKTLAETDDQTIFFVSHNMTAIQRLCTKCILLEKGSISGEGNPQEIVQKYASFKVPSETVHEISTPKKKSIPGYATRIAVEDENGKPTSLIPFGEAWQVRIDFTLVQSTHSFIIAAGLRTGEEFPIRTCWSTEENLQEGHYQAVFREENLILSVGRYCLVVGLSQSKQTFHYIDNLVFFEVVESSRGADFVTTSGNGIIYNTMDIKINKLR